MKTVPDTVSFPRHRFIPLGQNKWVVDAGSATAVDANDENTTSFPIWTHNVGDDISAGIMDNCEAPPALLN
jgi:hypothetical protein